MSEILSDEQIASLLEGAKQGGAPADRAGRRAARMTQVDFTRPTKFTADHERRVKRALTTFCRTASTRLSAELRTPIEFEVVDAVQLTWSHAHAQISPGSLCAVVSSEVGDGRMLLTVELPFMLTAIECLLGGVPGREAPDRKLTEIDMALAEHLFASLLNQMSAIWNDFAGVELGLQGIDSPMETAQIAPVSEPTLALTMEARVNRNAFTLALLTPHAAIAPYEESLLAREHGFGTERNEVTDAALRAAVGGIDVNLRAEVASVELPMTDVLALKAGDVVPLRRSADSGVTLCAEGVPVYRAVAGRNGPRRAVQIVERLDEGR